MSFGLAAILAVPLTLCAQECVPQWSTLEGPNGIGLSWWDVRSMVVHDDGSGPALYAGGAFSFIVAPDGSLGSSAQGVARWDGTDWTPVVGPGTDELVGIVQALEVFDDGSGPALYAGGAFTIGEDPLMKHVARWDGTTWSAVESPPDPYGTPGVGPFSRVNALRVFDDGSGPALYAGMQFPTPFFVTDLAFTVLRWDGTEWTYLVDPALGTPVTGSSLFAVRALEVFDDGTGPGLYVGGQFLSIGIVDSEGVLEELVDVNNIFRWKDGAWSPVAGPAGSGVVSAQCDIIPIRVRSVVRAMSVYDDGDGPALFVGGVFDTAGGLPIGSGIARWSGTEWSELPATIDSVSDCGAVHALAVFDDGSGPALYAGGPFRTIDDLTVNGIARWRTGLWSVLEGPAATGVTLSTPEHIFGPPSVDALAIFDDGSGPDLYAGGFFDFAGGETAPNIARWNGCASSVCPCDHNGDGVQTISDYFAFLTDFFDQLGGPGSADFDGSGVVTIADFFAFLNCLPAIAASTPCP